MTRTISIRVPDELFDALKRGAAEDRRHLGDYARLVLADPIDRLRWARNGKGSRRDEFFRARGTRGGGRIEGSCGTACGCDCGKEPGAAIKELTDLIATASDSHAAGEAATELAREERAAADDRISQATMHALSLAR